VNLFLAAAIGYLIGAKTGGKDLDQLTSSLKALVETDEFSDVIAAARSQVGGTLRALAAIVDSPGEPPAGTPDLLATVRHIVSQD